MEPRPRSAVLLDRLTPAFGIQDAQYGKIAKHRIATGTRLCQVPSGARASIPGELTHFLGALIIMGGGGEHHG